MKSERERNEMLEQFDAFLNDAGVDVCDFLCELGEAWRLEAEHVDHATAKSCLQSAAEGVSQAGMDWYVSTK